MSTPRLNVLLIEDNPGDARLIEEQLAGEPGFLVVHADNLAQGLQRLDRDIDAVLLDLGLPDCQGLESISRLLAQAPQLPIVVLTGGKDEALATQAVQRGAQDYLVKGRADVELLCRSLRYAVDRCRLLGELEHERSARESRTLERMAAPVTTSVIAALYGAKPLAEAAPQAFAGLVDQYQALLDLALEEQVMKTTEGSQGRLRDLAEQLGQLMAGPRDVVNLHRTALARVVRIEKLASRQHAYAEEGRFAVLSLMGQLVAFYRTYFSGTPRTHEPKESYNE